MSVRPLVLFPDHRLSIPCEKVSDFGLSLQNLLRDLQETLYSTPGVGLASPQIGILKQVSVIHIKPKKTGNNQQPNRGFYAIINPVLISGEGVQIPREGCLSVPDLLANVRRYEKVTVRSQDEKGEEKIITAEGFEALALQHEIDHLKGKLFLDRVTNLKTDIFRRKKY